MGPAEGQRPSGGCRSLKAGHRVQWEGREGLEGSLGTSVIAQRNHTFPQTVQHVISSVSFLILYDFKF